MNVLVVVPAYNEQENIVHVVEELKAKNSKVDYLIINDGSTDDTARICHERGYNLIDLPVNVGLSGAVKVGAKYAHLKGYDGFIQFDGDGQHDAEYIEEMIMLLEKKQVDIVIGSRFKNKKKNLNFRMIGNSLIEFAIKLMTGENISDPTSGMRLYGRKVMIRMANEINITPEPDTIAYLLKCKIKVQEIQVQMRERSAGESYLNLKRSLQYMLHMTMSIIFIQNFRKRS